MLAAAPAGAQADLTVTAASASCSNGALSINVTVRNQGTSNAGSFRVGVYVSTNNYISTGDTLIANVTRSKLNAGTSTDITGTVSAPVLTPGVYYIGAIADDLSQVAESDEANNWRAGNTLDLPCLYGNPDINIGQLDVTLTQPAKSLDSQEAPAAETANPRALLLANRTVDTDTFEKADLALAAGYQIIQFDDIPPLDVADALAAEGVTVLHYVPRNALMIHVPDELEGITIEDVVWVGSLLPVDKVSQFATKASLWDYVLVDVFEDVAREVAVARIEAAGGLVIENQYLLPHTFLVQGDHTVAMGLAELEIVSWVEPAPAPVVEGVAFHQCAGTSTPYGSMPKYVVRDDGWDGPGLGSANLKYYFANGTPDIVNSDEYPQVERALAEWARYADLSFTRTWSTGQSGCIDVKWASGDHGDGTPFDGYAGVLAHAFYPAGAGVETLAGDLHFDEAEPWVIAPGSGIDVFTIALHEIGHSLGLNHSSDSTAVMYGLIYANKVHTGLQPDDIAGIQSIYAAATASDTFNVSNTGTNTLAVSSIVPDTSAPWLTTSPSAPFSVAPGMVQPVRVVADYALAPAGSSTRRLLVYSNDSDESPYPGGVNVTVTASGTITPPTVTIGAASVSQTNVGPISFPVSYTNASSVTLTSAHVTLNKSGTANGTVSVSGSGTSSRTVTISSVTGNGYLSISIAAGSASNGAGSAGAAGPSNSVAVDNTAPTLSISTPSPSSTTTGPVAYTVTYSGATSISLAAANVTLVKSGTANATVSVSGTGSTSRTVTLSNVTGIGTLSISLAAGTASDAVGNAASAAGPSASCTVTNVVEDPVTAVIGPPSTYSTSTGPVTYVVSYSNATSVSLAAGDIVLQKTGSANASVSVSGSGTTSRTVTLSSITGNGSLGIYVEPGTASNSISTAPAAGPSNTVTVTNPTEDTVYPITVHIGPPSTYSTSTGPVSYNVTYTNATSITLSPSHVTLRKSGTANGTVSVSTTGTYTRRVTISNITGTGTLGIHINSGSASNSQYTAPSAGPSNNVNVSNTSTPPVDLTISAPSTPATVSGPVSYTITYTNATSVNLTAASVALNRTSTANGSVSVSGSGTTSRTVTISNISGSGTLSISIAAGTASNGGSTAPAIGPSEALTVSNEPIYVHLGPPSTYSTSTGPVSYTVTYTNASTITLSPSDITLNRTGSADATISVTTYGSTRRIVTLSNITGSGSLGIYLKAGTATNLAGFTAPAAGPSNYVTVQNAGGISTPITLHVAPPSTYSTATGPVSYTLTYDGADTITLVPSNVVLRTTGSATGKVSISTISSSKRSVVISSITGTGSIGIWIQAGTATNSGGYAAPSAGPSNSFYVTGPGAITTPPAGAETQLLGSVLAMDAQSGLAVPVTDAALRVWSGDDVIVTAVTDIDGAFYADGMGFGGPYNIEVLAPGYESQVLEDLSIEVENQYQEIFLAPSTGSPQITGSVTAAVGGDAVVSVGGAVVSLQQNGVEIAQSITSASGSFEFTGLEGIAGSAEVVVVADGFEPAHVTADTGGAQRVDVVLTADASAGAGLTGLIVDAETGGTLAADVQLREVGGSTTLSFRTDDSGLYEFAYLVPGDYVAHVTAQDYESTTENISLDDLETALNLALTPRASDGLLPRDGLSPGCAGWAGGDGVPTADILIVTALCALLVSAGRRTSSAKRSR